MDLFKLTNNRITGLIRWINDHIADIAKALSVTSDTVTIDRNVDIDGHIEADEVIATDLTVSDDAEVGGDLEVIGTLIAGGITEAITSQALSPALDAAGVVNTTNKLTEYTINGTNALTIGDGSHNGQVKKVFSVGVTASGSGTISGANVAGSYAMTRLGESVTLVWLEAQSKWFADGAVNWMNL